MPAENWIFFRLSARSSGKEIAFPTREESQAMKIKTNLKAGASEIVISKSMDKSTNKLF